MRMKYYIYLLFCIHFVKSEEHYADEINSDIINGY